MLQWEKYDAIEGDGILLKVAVIKPVGGEYILQTCTYFLPAMYFW